MLISLSIFFLNLWKLYYQISLDLTSCICHHLKFQFKYLLWLKFLLTKFRSKTGSSWFQKERVECYKAYAFWNQDGPDLVQIWSRFGPDLVQIWSRFGPDLVQIWSRFGPDLVQYWSILLVGRWYEKVLNIEMTETLLMEIEV